MGNFSAFPLRASLVCTLLAIFLLAFQLLAAAQAPAWQSARAVATATAAATDNYSYVAATAVDGAGNVYLAGAFRNSVVLGGTTLTSLGGFDVFVAKFNPASNQFVWAQRAGGTGNEGVAALAVSGTNVYVAGYFASPTAGFGPATLTNAGPSITLDVFVAKLDDAGGTGGFAWAQRAGGTGNDAAGALAVSGTNVYVAGYFQSPTAGFGPAALTNTGPVGTADVFVAKLDDAGGTGGFAWVQRAGGSDNDNAAALAVNGTSLYVAGYFQGPTAGFGSATLTNVGVVSNVFVAKLMDAGNRGDFVWAQRAGGTNQDGATALAVSGTSVYVAGAFNSATADFGPVTLATAGNTDVFVAKLMDAGGTASFVWAQQAGGAGGDYARALAVSGTSVYVAGTFRGATAGFGPTTLTNAGSGSDDMFVAKLMDAGSMGSFAWAQRAGGLSNDAANALALNGTSVYVAGGFTSLVADFGTFTVSNINPSPNPNPYVGFLASLTDATLTATAAATGPRAPAVLYPNPARRTATLHLPAGAASAPLTLTDAQGRSVRRYPAPAGSDATLDLRGLPAGLYLLRGVGLAQRLVVE